MIFWKCISVAALLLLVTIQAVNLQSNPGTSDAARRQPHAVNDNSYLAIRDYLDSRGYYDEDDVIYRAMKRAALQRRDGRWRRNVLPTRSVDRRADSLLAEIKSTTNAMRKNVQSTKQRGQALSNLQSKTGHLTSQSNSFRRNKARTKKQTTGVVGKLRRLGSKVAKVFGKKKT